MIGSAGRLLVAPLHDPGIFRAFLHGLELVLVGGEDIGEFRIGSEVTRFGGIGGDVVEFKLRAVDIGIDSAIPISGLWPLRVLGLPGGSRPEIRSKG